MVNHFQVSVIPVFVSMGEKDRQAFRAGGALDCVSLGDVLHTGAESIILCISKHDTLLDTYRPSGINISSSA